MKFTDCIVLCVGFISVACVLGYLIFALNIYSREWADNDAAIRIAEAQALEARFSRPVVIDLQEFLKEYGE